jgi:glutamyl-tRNA synthetase
MIAQKPRVRFAPSPTGELHVGGARTALFNYLFARKHGGVFVLRFEDTDALRNRPELIEPILEDLKWLGLDWDEGPCFQSERLSIYREYADRLLQAGRAYPCYCTPEELDAKRKKAIAEKRTPRYDGRCRGLTPEEREQLEAQGRRPALRFIAPREGATVVEDVIRGRIEFDNAEIDDFIIMRSDGRPTYNFAVVVDDLTMRITHVIRADEHLKNTPKQVLVYRALGAALPVFAHVPMVLAKDRTKLSKRHGATAVQEYRERGILPEALINYLARLGWSYGDQEIFSREELIEKFSLEGVHPSAAIFDEEKLLWLNHHYIMTGDPERLGRLTREFFIEEAEEIPDERWAKAVVLLKERARTLVELAEAAAPLLTDRIEHYDPKAVKKHLTAEKAPLLKGLAELLREIPEDQWNAATLERKIRDWLEAQGHKLKDLAQPCRVAVTGRDKGPGLFETLEFVGKERVLERLERVAHDPEAFADLVIASK